MSRINETELRVNVLGHTIDVSIVSHESPQHLATFLHGAGESTKERCLPLARKLAEHGWRCLTFSYPGHGNSSGELLGSSLNERKELTYALMKELGFLSSKLLVGVSMGAHTAISLLEHLSPERLVLFVPAAYAAEAESVPFGPGFSDILRREKSYHLARSWDILPTYTGELATIEAGDDKVIPRDVHELLHRHASGVRRKHHVTIQDSEHQISFWLAKEEQRLEDFALALHSFNFDTIIAKY